MVGLKALWFEIREGLSQFAAFQAD